MKLPRPFYRLPILFDVERLQTEVRALPASAWVNHPNEIAGNTSLRLITVNGGENDDVDGTMLPTSHLMASPYIRQVLSSFSVVWSRSRLMRLAPGAQVPPHADINYHWFNRVRMHIPIFTQPEVKFTCDSEQAHMAAGEAWLFDNWRQHSVINGSSSERIHLVADTSGSAAFWQTVLSKPTQDPTPVLKFDPHLNTVPLTEQAALYRVMPPSEMDLLVLDLRSELASVINNEDSLLRLNRYHALLEGFCKDWRQLHALYGDDESGGPHYSQLRDRMRNASQQIATGLVMKTNRVAAHTVLEARVLRVALPHAPATRSKRASVASHAFSRPIFIVAAPRSGSTLLFESLACHQELVTLGGEAHWLVENISDLQPLRGVDSNRLIAKHASDAVGTQIYDAISREARDIAGRPIHDKAEVRLLEKTPKNILRIPFFDELFPDALFVYLWRDPKENISSIMEAWRSGKWRTYNGLPEFDGPWSLLLPPGWQSMNTKPLHEIAAFQWDAANRSALDDLSCIDRERWLGVSYQQLVCDSRTTLTRICRFAGLPVNDALLANWSQPLPLSRYTLTAPKKDKWRENEKEIEEILPRVAITWERLKALE